MFLVPWYFISTPFAALNFTPLSLACIGTFLSKFCGQQLAPAPESSVISTGFVFGSSSTSMSTLLTSTSTAPTFHTVPISTMPAGTPSSSTSSSSTASTRLFLH